MQVQLAALILKAVCTGRPWCHNDGMQRSLCGWYYKLLWSHARHSYYYQARSRMAKHHISILFQQNVL